jgi:hypothetical protein
MQIVFFKRPKPNQFNYKPRYYDEEKERKEKRRKELEMSGSGDTSFMQSEIDRRWRRADRKNHEKARGINLLIYLAIIALLVYFMFFV